jgi:hypothetical protein
MGLYKGGLIYGGAYTWTIFCVSNKQVSQKQENKHVLITRFVVIKTMTMFLNIVLCHKKVKTDYYVFAADSQNKGKNTWR